jgi:hyperosmotically inducible protein
MKTHYFSALMLLAASPLAVFATPETDRKIEAAAKASYNYRTVLEDNVTVKSKDGVVTLTGKVRDKDNKALAEDTVENLPGVLQVRNDITIESAHPEKSDDGIAWKIRGRLLVKSNVSAATTKIAVQDGVVTLSGPADNEAQKTLTEVYAQEIDGVKSVRNEMVVKESSASGEKGSEKIDDASITSQVKYTLARHKGASALATTVKTTDSVVTVTGVAKSEAEKSLVTKLAQDVRGVKSVTNEMTLKN